MTEIEKILFSSLDQLEDNHPSDVVMNDILLTLHVLADLYSDRGESWSRAWRKIAEKRWVPRMAPSLYLSFTRGVILRNVGVTWDWWDQTYCPENSKNAGIPFEVLEEMKVECVPDPSDEGQLPRAYREYSCPSVAYIALANAVEKILNRRFVDNV